MKQLDQATIDWVRKQSAKGYPKEQLEKSLREQGYSEKDIEQAMQSYGQKVVKKKSTLPYIITIGILLMLLTAAGVMISKLIGEHDQLLAEFSNVKTRASDQEQEMTIRIEELQRELNSTERKYQEQLEKKEQLIEEMKQNMTEIEGKKTNETGKQAEETEENQTQTETEEEEPETGLVASKTRQLAFENESVEWEHTEFLQMPASVYNDKGEDIIMKGRVFCMNDLQEEFELAEIPCEWVRAGETHEFNVTIPPYATDQWFGRRDCYLEMYETDQTCEMKVGGLKQVPFEMHIWQ